jgi:hypothetical protein
MGTKIIEVSEYAYERLDSLSYAHDLSISALVEIGVNYLESENKWCDNQWEDFLESTSPILHFVLHSSQVFFDNNNLKIYPVSSFAYQQLKQNISKLKDSLKSFYKKDFNVTLVLEHHD